MDPIAYLNEHRRSSYPSSLGGHEKDLARCRKILAFADDEMSQTEESCECSRSSSLTDLDESTSDWASFDIDDIFNSTTPAAASCSRRRSDGILLKRNLFEQSPKKDKTAPRRVSFGQVQIRVCQRILGDNIPSGSTVGDGPSLSLGWAYNTEKPLAVDKYESKRSSQRRASNSLLLSPEKREKIAKKAGFTRKDIDENVKLISKTQRRRNRTIKELEKEEMAQIMQISRQKCLNRFLQTQAQPKTYSNSKIMLSSPVKV